MIIGHDVFVITSWRDAPEYGPLYSQGEIGTISLTLHKETELASPLDYTSGGILNSQVPAQITMILSNPAPNPASSAQRIDVVSGGAQTASFRIFDIAGRLVLNEDVNLSKGQNSVVWTEFSETLPPSGNYLISVTAEDGSVMTTRSVLIR